MQIVLLIIAVLAVLFVASMVVALVAAALFTLVMAAAVAVPLYFVGRAWLGGGRTRKGAQPLERLQTLYVEGKIDLFEYERRVAKLIAVEH
jgi:membrane protein implicated in regulation of membrane protease activity